MNLVLLRRGYPPVAVRPEDRPGYIRALQQVGPERFDRLLFERLDSTLGEYSGSFGSPPSNRFDCRQPMLGEMFETLNDFVSEASYQGQRGIPDRCQYFGRVTGMSTGLVFLAADITNVMKTVFDTPVRARQSQQLFSTRPLRGETGDRVDCLDGFLATYDALARNAADLRHAGPERVQIFSQRRSRLQPSGLDPAVALLNRFGRLEVSRRGPCRRGGKRA
jgi:hypothetical protein